MWFDHRDPRALYQDRRHETYVRDRGTAGTKNRLPVVVAPDATVDFTQMPWPDDTFWHVVFDPPHYTEKSLGLNSCLCKHYGVLLPGWEEMIAAGFVECFRVLKPFGTLIFKWCSTEIPLSRVLALTPHQPLYGHQSGRKSKTHWVAFLKPNFLRAASEPLSQKSALCSEKCRCRTDMAQPATTRTEIPL